MLEVGLRPDFILYFYRSASANLVTFSTVLALGCIVFFVASALVVS